MEPTRTLLLLVHELHKMGYQKLRIAPGMAASGMQWRCQIAPSAAFEVGNGARLASSEAPSLQYSSADGDTFFGWEDAPTSSVQQLAEKFVERFPELAGAGLGSDWAYAGWFLELLRLTAPNALPIAYADWDLPTGYLSTMGGGSLRLPLPPAP
jgi:hypothetical protein